MISFLKQRLGYGLAGFLVGLFVMASIAKYTQFSAWYWVIVLMGFVLGLIYPGYIGQIFQMYKARPGAGSVFMDPSAPRYSTEELDKVQKGPLVYIVYAIGLAMLAFLVYVVLK